MKRVFTNDSDCYLHSMHKSRFECETISNWQHDTTRYLPYLYPTWNFGSSPWRGSVILGSAERRQCRLISHEIVIEVCQFYVTTMPQHHRRTDGRFAVAISCSVLHSGLTVLIGKHLCCTHTYIHVGPASRKNRSNSCPAGVIRGSKPGFSLVSAYVGSFLAWLFRFSFCFFSSYV